MARYVLLLAAAVAAQPQGYQYDANAGVNYKYDINNPQPFVYDANSGVNYKYDINNPQPFVYNYQYDPNAAPAFNLNGDPLALTDATIAQTSAITSKIAESLKTFSDNKLLKKLIESSEDPSDPCSGLATNLDSTVTNLVDGVAGSRTELASIIASIQKMKANRQYPSAAIRSVSEALVNFEPLLPRFASLISFNSACKESMDEVAKKYNTVGAIVPGAGGETSKALGKLAANLGRNNFDNLCGENANLPRDALFGVADILDGLKEIVETFEGSAQDTREIASTAALLKDGAVSIFFLLIIFPLQTLSTILSASLVCFFSWTI